MNIPGGFKGLLVATALMGGVLLGVACGDDSDGGGSTIDNTGLDAGGSSSGKPSSSSGGSSSGSPEDAGPTTFTVGGSVTGLAGATGLVLQLNGANNLNITADGAFVFPTPLADGDGYTVTISTQPTGKTCSVSAGVGTIAKANASGVVVNCASSAFTVGGTISGLATNASVTVTLNGANATVRNANGAYAFSTTIATGGAYAVAVSVQPTSPSQTCTVANASGTMGNANVTNVNVTCTTNTFTVGGTVAGLATGASLVVQNNLGGNKTINANGAYNFPAQASGTAYSVTVLTQPNTPVQTCTVANPSGNVAGANVTNVNITCTTTTFKVGGNLTGLGGGKSIVLTNNGGNDLTLDTDGAFQFTTGVASGAAYNVQVKTQPAGQNCSVSAGGGNVGSGNVTTVVVNCGNTFTVGGSVSGLAGGTSVILRNNNAESVQVSSNANFAFPTPLNDAAAYNVTVQTQPSNPTQTCVVNNGSGNIAAANVTNIQVVCTTNKYKVGGTIAGLANAESTTIRFNTGAGETLVVPSNGNWVFPTSVDSGTTYNVNVTVQPTGTIEQICTIENAAGTVGAGDVTNVAITCAAKPYTVGGKVTGLAAGTSVTILDNGGDSITVNDNMDFTFPTGVPSGSTYVVTVQSHNGIPDQTCNVVGNSDSGTITNANVTNVHVACSTNSYHVGGTLTGLDETNVANQVTLTVTVDGVGQDLVRTDNGAFQFPNTYLSGKNYAVTVKTNPTMPTQTCNVSAGTGQIGATDITTVVVNCATNTYTIGGSVTGLAPGNTVVLSNGGEDLPVSSANFAFLTPVASGQGYAVSVKTSPTSPISQTCTVSGGGTGTVSNANITTVQIACTTNTYTISGTVVGLETGNGGSQVVLTNNDGDDETVVAATPDFTFNTAIPSGNNYNVKVKTNPSSPYQQTCVVTSGGSGTVAASNIAGIVITCTTTEYQVSTTVAGIDGTYGSLVIRNNGASGDQITTSANGTYTFTTTVKNGYPFAVTLFQQPVVEKQICKVVDGSGTMPTANKNVKIYCGWTCLSMHTAEPALYTSGLFTLDPDGPGGIDQTTYYCDMDFAGGGWSLILSTAGSLGPSELATDIVTPGSNKRIPQNDAIEYARRSSQVHVRTPAVTPTVYATSVADALPIQNLRLAKILNFGIPAVGSPNATARAQWTVSGLSAQVLDFGPCSPTSTTWPEIYHACDNQTGWHLVGTTTKWDFSQAEVAQEVYVK